MLEDVDDEMLDYSPDMEYIETIGTLLEHIVAVDWGWIFMDMGEQKMEYERFKYGYPLRSWSEVKQQTGKNKQYYMDKIETIREEIINELSTYSDDDLTREFKVSDADTTFTFEWLCFHLINHEAMHLGQISLLKRLYRLEHNEN